MRAIFESIFDIVYLCTVLSLGLIMIKKSGKGSIPRKVGYMALVLGGGDAFHLIPRMVALLTDGVEAHAVSLGFGKLVTSITATLFYLMLYDLWQKRYYIKGRKILTSIIWSMAFIRIILCLLPQNQWFTIDPPLSWGIYRNIPFLVMGMLIIIIFYQEAYQHEDSIFSKMWLAIILSFGFYIPVVLFAATIPMIGMLMIPKTIAYLWMILMGYKTIKEEPLIVIKP